MDRPKIFVAGHNGMVGSAICRILKKQDLIILTKEKNELDLLNQESVKNFFKNNQIDQIYLAAAKVGGINANNTYPAQFIYENLMIQSNIIHSAFKSGIKKLLFLGSSCIYPKNANQPISEEELLNGKLESTNEPYAIAKIAGIKLCESYNRQYGEKYNIDYRSVMPTNLYGQGDNYHPENSHVIPALIYRFNFAKNNNLPKINIWGTGKPKREFLHVDDLAKACILVMNLQKDIFVKEIFPQSCHINVGSGFEVSISDLAKMIKEIIGYKGSISFDTTKPDGTMRKLLDSSRIHNFGFKPEIRLKEGLLKTIKDYIEHLKKG
jgi:GDP-L-fucose synthase